jgi:hypothetical protein
LLGAAGLLTLRSGVFARWIGIVALLGAVAFFITFFTLIVGPSEDSVFGYGFFVGFLALAIWSIATSIAQYRNRHVDVEHGVAAERASEQAADQEPTAIPRPDMAPYIPKAVLRCLPSGKVVVIDARAFGAMSAAPTPCRARARTITAAFGANPATSAPTVKTTRPTWRIRLRPYRSPRRPPNRSRAQCACQARAAP